MERMVRALESVEPTYRDIGATLAGSNRRTFTMTAYESVLCSGPEAIQRAVTVPAKPMWRQAAACSW